MKELDFDELDKAVNSLMANVPKTSPQTDDAKVKTLSLDSTVDDDSAPLSFSKVEETAAKAVDEAAAAPAAAAEPAPKTSEPAAHAAAVHARPQPSVTAPSSRKSGRFMDVVHPSADMKKPDVPRPISRQGATIEPLNASSQKISDIVPQNRTKPSDEKPIEAPKQEEEPVVKEDTPELAPVTAPVASASVEEPSKTDEAPSSVSDWPDPLDMMTSEPEKKGEEEAKAEPEAPEDEEPKAEEAPTPLTSPFLPDTKVEKRPLGGVPVEAEAPVEEPSRPPVVSEEETPKTIDDPNAQLPANPNEVETQLPEELRGDLMAVEADTTHDELKQAHESHLGVIAPSKPMTQTKAPEPSASEEPVAAGPTSIPQQYREEPSTGDKDNGAIYDTDTYHQPLSHPAKKKSGWLWVVGIIAVLLLGAGGGAALFLLGLV